MGFFFEVLDPATKKESIFTKEGVFGCDAFNLRFWKLRRSTLLRKVVSCGSGDTAFSQKKFDLPAVGKSRWIFFLRYLQSESASPEVAKNHYDGFFFQMCRG